MDHAGKSSRWLTPLKISAWTSSRPASRWHPRAILPPSPPLRRLFASRASHLWPAPRLKTSRWLLDAVQFADRSRIHVFLRVERPSTSNSKLKIGRQEALDRTAESVRLARSFVDDVEFSPEDATRSDRAFLIDMVRVAVEAGATTINMPDTVGYTTPEEYGQMFREVRAAIPAIDAEGIVLSSHCHDDLGLAVANSLAAINAGARQVECTINGIGERAGNASLEEIAAALYVRAERYGVHTNIKLDQLYPTSQVLGQIITFRPSAEQSNRWRECVCPRIGNSSTWNAGQSLCYEIMTPALVGVSKTHLVLGKHSGRAALRHRLEQLGYTLSREELQQTYYRFCRNGGP